MENLPSLVIFDLDGTILKCDHKTISEKTFRILKKITEKEIPLAINTGRCADIIPFEIFPKITYTITCNGACILGSDRQILKSTYISEEALKAAWQTIEKYHIVMQLFSDKRLLMERKILRNLSEYVNVLPVFHRDYLQQGVAEEIEDFGTSIYGGMHRITKINFPGKAIALVPELKKELEELQLFELASDGLNLELTAKGCNKRSALEWIFEKEGIDATRAVAFGDGENDRPMLRGLKWGVAMGNAAETVKKDAMYVALSNREDGVAQFLEDTFDV